MIGDGQQPHPNANQRNIQDYQQQIADPEAHDQPPEQGRLIGHEGGAGRYPVDHQRAQHKRHGRATRNAK